MTTTVSLQKLGNITITLPGGRGARVGALESLIKSNLKSKLQEGDRATYDVLHDIIENDPKTGTVKEDSIRQLVAPANYFLGTMYETLGATLNRQDSFPLAKLTTTPSVAQRRVTLLSDVAGRSVATADLDIAPTPTSASGQWADLSPGYLRRIGFKLKRNKKDPTKASFFRNGQQPKRFWSEQRRAIKSGKGNRGRMPLGKEARKEMHSLSELLQGGISGRILSSNGLANTFSFSESGRRRRARTYARTSTKGKQYVVWGVTGSLFAPDSLTATDDLDREFYNVTLKSMLSGTRSGTGSSGQSMFNKEGKSWAAVMLTNENRRPWISHMFAQSKPLFFRYMREELSKKSRL